jgi:hypothetical protein
LCLSLLAKVVAEYEGEKWAEDLRDEVLHHRDDVNECLDEFAGLRRRRAAEVDERDDDKRRPDRRCEREDQDASDFTRAGSFFFDWVEWIGRWGAAVATVTVSRSTERGVSGGVSSAMRH